MHYYSSDKHDFIHKMGNMKQKDHKFVASLGYTGMNKSRVGFYFTKTKLSVFFSEYSQILENIMFKSSWNKTFSLYFVLHVHRMICLPSCQGCSMSVPCAKD